jgi:hypothetical protein
MRDAKGLVRVTVLAGLALMTASSTVRIAVAQEKGGGDVTGSYDFVSDWPLPVHAARANSERHQIVAIEIAVAS